MIALLTLIPLLVFIYYRILDSSHLAPTTMDFIIGSYSPQGKFPLLWFLCPLLTMLALMTLWKEKDSVQIITRQKTPRRIWFSRVCDIVAISFAAALLMQVSIALIGYALIGTYSDFDVSTSMFSHELSGLTLSNLSLWGSFSVTFAYCFMVLLFENMVFGVLCWVVKKPKAILVILAVVNLPQVHGTSSIIYDIMRNITGGSLAIANPLSLPYEASSISYASWLPGAGHSLWYLALFVVVLLCAGILFDKVQDHC